MHKKDINDRLRLPSQNTCWKFILTECDKGSDYLLLAKSPRNFFEYTVTWNLAGKLLEQRSHWATRCRRYRNVQWIPETEIFACFRSPKFSSAYCEPETPGYVHFAHEFRASDEQWPLPIWDLYVSDLYFFLQKKFFFNLFSSPIKGKSKNFVSLQKWDTKINVNFAK